MSPLKFEARAKGNFKIESRDVDRTLVATKVVKPSVSAKGKDFNVTFEKLLSVLVNAVAEKIDPKSNPEIEGPIFSTLEAKIDIVLKVIDGNKESIFPVQFDIESSDPGLGSLGAVLGKPLSKENVGVGKPKEEKDLTRETRVSAVAASQYNPLGPGFDDAWKKKQEEFEKAAEFAEKYGSK